MGTSSVHPPACTCYWCQTCWVSTSWGDMQMLKLTNQRLQGQTGAAAASARSAALWRRLSRPPPMAESAGGLPRKLSLPGHRCSLNAPST